MPPKNKLAIWEGGGHALIVADTIRLRGGYEIVGFLDDVNPALYGAEFCEAEILAGSQKLAELKHNVVDDKTIHFRECKTAL
ncbi:MAG: hypothetical protein HY028_07890 [Gammaproteobacteria bacterium]|nr:hypothetical protein [Gammaproteobacteria bacterium]